MSESPRVPVPLRREGEEQVTNLELFFDLVFVFAITQVSELIAHHPTAGGVVRGLLVLALVWWAWAGYSWLTNNLDPEDDATRIAMFAATGAMLVAAIALPRVYGDEVWWFVGAYAFVRLAHIVLYLIAARGDKGLRNAMLRLGGSSLIAVLLLAAAAASSGDRRAVWIAVAVFVDFGGALVGHGAGWFIAAHHFAERYGLIILIALGESIVSIGVGAQSQRLDWALVAAALLGLATAVALWWAYFDVVATVAARRLARYEPLKQVLIARDAYSYLHYGLVAGIVLYAFGAKEAIAEVHGHLPSTAAACLTGGIALYLLTHVAFRLRNLGTVNWRRLAVAIVLLAYAPFADEPPALVTMAIVAFVSVALMAYEAIRFSDVRRQIRQGDYAGRLRREPANAPSSD
jgi:low temperature requirement protein LtrA